MNFVEIFRAETTLRPLNEHIRRAIFIHRQILHQWANHMLVACPSFAVEDGSNVENIITLIN